MKEQNDEMKQGNNGQGQGQGQGGEHRPHRIIVNTRERVFNGDEISFREVVKLAFPDAKFDGSKVYTVAYSKGDPQNPQGTMTDGGKNVIVIDGMIFDVERHDKS